MIDCRYYETCSAPLCPKLSEKVLNDMFWYPDEEICKNKEDMPEWVKVQKKIQKKVKPENVGYMFTVGMLKKVKKVTKEVKGKLHLRIRYNGV